MQIGEKCWTRRKYKDVEARVAYARAEKNFVPEIWGGTHRLRMRIYYTDSRNWREIYGCIISTFCLHILKIYFSNQKQILEIVCRIVLRLAKIVSLPNCWAFVLNTNWIFRTEWKSELDWQKKWRIKVTQILFDCRANGEDPDMKLALAVNSH